MMNARIPLTPQHESLLWELAPSGLRKTRRSVPPARSYASGPMRRSAGITPKRESRWDEAFQQFEAAVQQVHQAPRTHREGSMKSAKPYVELFKLGRSMPWITVMDVPGSR